MINNFKKIEEDLISRHGEPPAKVKKNIDSTFGIFRIMGDILELFVPNMIQLFVNLAGGENKSQK
jgi:hypothetical protein